MDSPTLLAVPIVRPEPALEEQVRAACAAGADVIELRVDCIGDADAVANLLQHPQPVPVILTIRTRDEGGCWDGSDDERVELLERLGSLRPGFLDVEYTTWSHSASAAGQSGGSKNRVILSHHDLVGTPTDLDKVLRPLSEQPADVVKVVFTARDATDAWRVLDLLRRQPCKRQTIALAMGEAGLLTRVLAPKFGGFLTFAALSRGAESAPGQPTVRDLLDLYRWRDIGPRTGVYGVVGWPVSHSRSPHIHNAAMTAEGIDGVFVPMPVAPTYADFARFMDYQTQHPELDVWGLSVTIPHKEHALRWLDQRGFGVSEVARRAGAVNTMARTDSANWAGDNTDVDGALRALEAALTKAGDELSGRNAIVLGAGGAARAVVVGLRSRDCSVTVVNRTPERAQALARDLHCQWQPWEDRSSLHADIVVNCTSVGMVPHVDASPMPVEALRSEMLVFDTVYTPPETRLMHEAHRVGCRVVGGAAMFIGQAARQFETWHRRGAPTEVMRTVMESLACH